MRWHILLERGTQQIQTAVHAMGPSHVVLTSKEVPSRFELLYTVLQTAT